MAQEKDLAVFGSPSAPLVVKLREYKGARFLDIRRYYKDKKSGELKPTQKGVTLKAGALEPLIKLLTECEADIENWLSAEVEEPEETVLRTMAARADGLAALSLSLPEYVVKTKPMRSPVLSRVQSEGQKTTLELNASHPFFLLVDKLAGPNSTTPTSPKSAKNAKDEPAALLVFHLLLLSFAQTRALFDDTQEVLPANLLSMFDYEWGKVLGNFANQLTEHNK